MIEIPHIPLDQWGKDHLGTMLYDMIAEGLVEAIPLGAPLWAMYRYKLTPAGWAFASGLRSARAERSLGRNEDAG